MNLKDIGPAWCEDFKVKASQPEALVKKTYEVTCTPEFLDEFLNTEEIASLAKRARDAGRGIDVFLHTSPIYKERTKLTVEEPKPKLPRQHSR